MRDPTNFLYDHSTFCNPTFEMNKYFYALQKEKYSNFINQLHCMFEIDNEGL